MFKAPEQFKNLERGKICVYDGNDDPTRRYHFGWILPSKGGIGTIITDGGRIFQGPIEVN